MNDIIKPLILAAFAIPVAIWAWDNLRDPQEAATQCLAAQLRGMGDITAGEGDIASRKSFMEPCRSEIERWTARDGEAAVKKQMTAVFFDHVARTSADPGVAALARGLQKKAVTDASPPASPLP